MTLTKFQKDLLQKFVDKQFREAEQDSQTFDLEAHLDSSLSYSENKSLIAKKLIEAGIITTEKRYEKLPKKAIKEEQERLEMEQIRKEEEESNELQRKAIENIKKQPSNIKKYFFIPRKLVNSFLDEKQKDISGMILQGEAGIGKTKLCMDIFKERTWILNDDYAILSGYATPLELFIFLYKNRDKRVILFDDIAKQFDNELSKGLLLSALWNPTGKRFCTYQSTTEKLVDDEGNAIPRTFPLTTKILWCLNNLPLELQNIKSRCYYYEMDFNYKTKIQIIYEICKLENIPIEIADYISDTTNEAYQIDFRLPLKLFGLWKTNKDDFQKLAKAILKPDEDLVIIKDALAKYPSVNEAITEYINRTGHSRATFFRRKKLLVQNIFFEEVEEVSKSQSITQMDKVKV